MADMITAPSLKKMRDAGKKIVCLTAYDYPSALIADAAGVDLVLVGDSLGTTIQGHETTLPVDLEDVCYHTSIVRRGIKRALLVADLPFGSYNVSVEQAVESSILLMKAGASAVKLESDYTEAISAITKAGIPVMGHLGYTPQSFYRFGGAKIQGKGDSGSALIEIAKELESAGAFGIVLELIPADLAKRITNAISIPTIGIGAGIECSGEIQVWHDILGISETPFRHTKFFMNGRDLMSQAVQQYVDSVRQGSFPGPENSV